MSTNLPPDMPTHNNSNLESRVGKVEVALESLHEDVTSLKSDLRVVASSVTKGFDDVRRDNAARFDEIRRETAANKQTNWGWIAAFAGVGLTFLVFTSTSIISPLSTFDKQLEARVERVQNMEMQSFERAIRIEERNASLQREFDRLRGAKP